MKYLDEKVSEILKILEVQTIEEANKKLDELELSNNNEINQNNGGIKCH